jgi:myo-inositol-1(or 4)-monophosphatase
VPAPDWLELCRRAASRAAEALDAQADRSEAVGPGAGGDTTLAVDRAAENAVFAELEALDGGLLAISEERGEVEVNGGGVLRVVVDPVDGSRNARRAIYPYALSVAVADGPALCDVEFAFVHEFEQGQEWWARRHEGSYRDGERLSTSGADQAELLGLENTHPSRVAAAAGALEATGAERLRALGAVAISLCHVGSGGLDAMLTLGETRSVDLAAAQLVVREAGGAVTLPEAGDLHASLSLDMRSRVMAAATPAGLDRLRAAFP